VSARRLIKDFCRCPDCGSELCFQETVSCLSCARVFSSADGIYDLRPSQPPPRPRFYDNPAYGRFLEKLDESHVVHYQGRISGFIERIFKRHTRKFFGHITPPYVDLGCGTGSGFFMFPSEAGIIGLDNSRELLAGCRKKFSEATLVCCDILKSPFKNESFKNIFCIATLEHIFKLEAFIESIYDMLDADGTFYVTVPAEGGLLWGLGRTLVTLRGKTRLWGEFTREIIRLDHCNTAYAVENALRKYFTISRSHYFPFRIGGISLNMICLYALKK
jgi:SAM-dependent methyltransferase